MAKKFYAVKVGKKPGIYETWAECQSQISGFSGAIYRGFSTQEEAMVFLKNTETEVKSKCPEMTPAIAYVDGSYDHSQKRFSYGMVLMHDGVERYFAYPYADKELATIRNVAGEIKGSEAAMRFAKENGYKKIAGIALGGKERYDSVHSGLELIQTLMSSGAGQLSRDEEWLSGEDYIFIHDGARPCVTAQIIYNCMQDVMEYKACVAAVPVKDTIKVADKAGMSVNTPDRSTLWQIQTPQVFEAGLIKEAYERLYNDTTAGNITDDAMVVEHYMDRTVKMTMADYKNIKVTTPEDMDIARIFLKA